MECLPALLTNGNHCRKKELVQWVCSVSDLYMGNNMTLLRKLRNPQRTPPHPPQLYKETVLISVYFLNSAGLEDFLILVWAWNCWHFLRDSWIPVQEGLWEQRFWRDEQQAQRCAGVLSPSLLTALQPNRLSAWVLVPRQGALGSEATPLKPLEMILVLYVMSFKCCLWAQKNTRGLSLGYTHQNTGILGHSQMPAASHRT